MSFSVRPLVGRISAVSPQTRCERLSLVEIVHRQPGPAHRLDDRRRCRARPARSCRRGRGRRAPCRPAARGSSRRCPARARAAGRSRTPPAARPGSAAGGRSQMPIVRSPCTLEWPRTGNSPAPGLPMLPCAKARLTTSLMVATALRCWVSPIAQQNTVRVGVARASRAASVICSRVSPVTSATRSQSTRADVRPPLVEAGGVAVDEVVVERVPLAPAASRSPGTAPGRR